MWRATGLCSTKTRSNRHFSIQYGGQRKKIEALIDSVPDPRSIEITKFLLALPGRKKKLLKWPQCKRKKMCSTWRNWTSVERISIRDSLWEEKPFLDRAVSERKGMPPPRKMIENGQGSKNGLIQIKMSIFFYNVHLISANQRAQSTLRRTFCKNLNICLFRRQNLQIDEFWKTL